MGTWVTTLNANNYGVNGQTVATAAASISSTLASITTEPTGVLLNWGANDMGAALPSQATWETNLTTIVDAVNAKWPSVKVYIMRPWRRGEDADSDTLAGWIANVQAARPSFVVIGPDERVWLKGADDGVTMTTDGVHYSVAGNVEAAKQWRAAMVQ